MFVKIVGVRGSGKSTVTAEMQRLFVSQGIDTQMIKGSELMARYLGIDPTELSRVPERDRIRARQAVYKGLYAYDLLDPSPKVRLRDGHSTIVQRDAYGDIRVSEVALVDGDANQLKAICLLDPSLPVILHRRRLDLKIRPERNVVDLELLRSEWDYERRIATRQAAKLDIPLYSIENERTVQETSKTLITWMRYDLGDELEKCKFDGYEEGSVRKEFA